MVYLSQSKPEQKAKCNMATSRDASVFFFFREMKSRAKSNSSESDPNIHSEMTQWQMWESGNRGLLLGLKKQHRSMLPLRSAEGFSSEDTVKMGRGRAKLRTK